MNLYIYARPLGELQMQLKLAGEGGFGAGTHEGPGQVL